ncbi:hypothetical protein MA16_Dca021334 [Dendrobium catenatum]|uniref:Uncharacterized protein n=1 Tax=Dendrobium catenatum TaxID=906689 RepID=A0A2I0WWW4_9ASPA|nr:hypothetical protein MA16_Dca021334 [Dendrobium catenatum]
MVGVKVTELLVMVMLIGGGSKKVGDRSPCMLISGKSKGKVQAVMKFMVADSADRQGDEKFRNLVSRRVH